MNYNANIEAVHPDSTISDFRSAPYNLSWFVRTRPDIAVSVAFSAQSSENLDVKECIELQNRVFKHINTSRIFKFQFPKLDEHTFYIKAFPY